MIRRWALAVLVTITFVITTTSGCEDSDDGWVTLGTVHSISKGSRVSTVYLNDGSAYKVDTYLLDDCGKGATLKVAGFLYTCW